MHQFIICIDSPGYGGSEKDLIRMLSMVEENNLIVYCNPDCDVELINFFKSRNFAIRYTYAPNSKVYFIRGLYNSIKIISKNFNSKFAVWAHHSDSNRWLQLTLALLRRKYLIIERAGAPTVASLKKSKLTKPIKRYVIQNALKVIYCGQGMMKESISIFNIRNSSNIYVIPNTRNVSNIFSEVLQIRNQNKNNNFIQNNFNVLTISRLDDQQKGISTLLESINLLNKKTLPITLSIVGAGQNREEFEKMVKNYQLNNVSFHGADFNIIPYLANADVFVLPSLYEGLSGALIEAMAAKLPCIATDIPGNNELVINNKTGLLVPVKDPVALAKAIESIISDKTLASELAEAGYNHVLNNYDESIEKIGWQKIFKGLNEKEN